MAKPPAKPKSDFALLQLLPNMLTIAAIIAGLTAIRYGVQGNYLFAVQLILVAGVLDGMDGRVARILGADSKMGAELDSLADFLNFGVAPALIVYFWALQELRGIGWIAALVFAVCCVVRLARFNVAGKSEETEDSSGEYFVGVPAPAGALLAMLPMYLSFAFDDAQLLPSVIIAGYVVVIGLLMISHIPTWSFKTTRVSRANVKYFLVAFAFVAAAVWIYAWITLAVFCFAYVAMVLRAWFTSKKSLRI
ncbi:MAG: CDP-diacylglycerol--serine O-phosphatidyltransferase [Rhodobacteraceae bacterium]|nr:MAG: CDP-diacylglycerol--serine O-phosphatidyltransferase [Paracoccaceae bacterium]